MNFSKQNVEEVRILLSSILEHPKVQLMKQHIQHGDVSTYEHCMNVAITSYILSKKIPLSFETKELLRGAILHDFFLYDWHGKRIGKEGLHCFTHSKIALENAEKYFSLSTKERDIVRNHMFPATLFHAPTCREAVVVCIADKICAFVETFEVGLLNGMWLFLFQKNIFHRKEDKL